MLNNVLAARARMPRRAPRKPVLRTLQAAVHARL
jgi:hypothetical protein